MFFKSSKTGSYEVMRTEAIVQISLGFNQADEVSILTLNAESFCWQQVSRGEYLFYFFLFSIYHDEVATNAILVTCPLWSSA